MRVAAVVALEHDAAPAGLRGLAVGRERDDRHHLQVLVEVPFARALAAAAVCLRYSRTRALPT